MENNYQIQIYGLKNLNDFVREWSPIYSYPNEEKYNNHISRVLETKESFIELFKWKNGTGDVISKKKLMGVMGYWEKIEILKSLQQNFDWEKFETEFEPQSNSTIWKLFLLHLINPNEFPIFDQHVYRSFMFIEKGIIEEIPLNSKKKYLIFKTEYLGWFNQLKKEFEESPKKMDESFFSFGRMLKGLKDYPFQIIKG